MGTVQDTDIRLLREAAGTALLADVCVASDAMHPACQPGSRTVGREQGDTGNFLKLGSSCRVTKSPVRNSSGTLL